jgi:hypothetical protein
MHASQPASPAQDLTKINARPAVFSLQIGGIIEHQILQEGQWSSTSVCQRFVKKLQNVRIYF